MILQHSRLNRMLVELILIRSNVIQCRKYSLSWQIKFSYINLTAGLNASTYFRTQLVIGFK